MQDFKREIQFIKDTHTSRVLYTFLGDNQAKHKKVAVPLISWEIVTKMKGSIEIVYSSKLLLCL